MSKFSKAILAFLPFAFIVGAYQNCSEKGFSNKGQVNQTSDTTSIATIEVAAVGDSSDIVLEVPAHMVAKKVNHGDFQWFFIDEDGNDVDLQNDAAFFDLRELDPSTFLRGHFLVRMPAGSDVKQLAFVFRRIEPDIEIDQSTVVMGMVIGEPIVGLRLPPIQPQVLGLPHPADRPVVGLPEPFERPVVGLPEPRERPVIGVPKPARVPNDQPVVGLPKPLGAR